MAPADEKRIGGPPILAGSIFPRAIRRAARWADGLYSFSFGPSMAEIGAGFEAARKEWKQAGRDRPPSLATGFWFALGSDGRGQMDTYLRTSWVREPLILTPTTLDPDEVDRVADLLG